jgi:transcriptional regulator with XRE-family HTH domain
MSVSEQIRVLCAKLNISKAELARRMGTSPQNLSAKMKRESFTVQELEQIADVAGVAYVHRFALKNGEEI